jgi:hypothetical protein
MAELLRVKTKLLTSTSIMANPVSLRPDRKVPPPFESPVADNKGEDGFLRPFFLVVGFAHLSPTNRFFVGSGD